MERPLRFGSFVRPLHSPTENPTLALDRDLDLVDWFERIGYDEVWIGEHHSGGFETIGSPEMFLAAASQRTKRIRLGTGVISLPYHHPFLVAERMVLLDHLSHGRAMMGVGPGALPYDSHMLGVDYMQNRDKMGQALDAIIQLLQGEKPVTMKTDWFTLRDAELNLAPFTYPRFEICPASVASPSGSKLAGRYGTGLLSVAANSPAGFEALANTWSIVEAEAEHYGQDVDRGGWRVVGFCHLADTDKQARKDLHYGLADYCRYYKHTPAAGFWHPDESDLDASIDRMISSGFAVIGTPDRLIEAIDRLKEQTGGFGCFLLSEHECADRAATLRSHEIVARQVMPHFQGSNERPSRAFALHEKIGTPEITQAQASAKETYQKELSERAKLASNPGNEP